ncbi:MAG: hypothetical protein KAX47_12340 [Zoogloea sp.]|nr:hypothetical protein [Zoogloea sp.]
MTAAAEATTNASAAVAGISQAEFARQIGVAKSWVTALKIAGRLVLTADGKVDAVASIARIAATTDPNRDDVARRHAAARAGHPNAPGQPALSPGQQTPPDAPPAPAPAPLQSAPAGAPAGATAIPDEVGHTYQAARAVKEKYAAMTARLEYRRASGEVIDREAVAAAIEDIVTALRQGLEQQPNRLAPELVGLDLDAIRATLKRETTAALTALSKEFHTRLQQLAGPPEHVA